MPRLWALPCSCCSVASGTCSNLYDVTIAAFLEAGSFLAYA